ncbi:MAG: VOC family protein, partial [Candidatus Saccharimonadales bacterium]
MLGECKTFSGYSVNDIAIVRTFYESALGIKVEQNEMGLQLFLNNQHVYIYEKADHQPATFTVLNFIVENIDEAADTLVKAGITFEH